ncbi:MAG: beta-ketoacyl synthase chain length factor, partial [Gammaproteobacteria bacterium]
MSSAAATARSGSSHTLYIEGIGFWASRLPGWDAARAILRGEAPAPATPQTRPAPAILPPAERRRAPDTVAVSLEVAARACEMAARDPKLMPSVFASTHGDLAISDAICDTLARTPSLTSPTKFHNSVHNAAAGYWTIATGCLEPYTSLSGYYFTFAEGLLEAASQALHEGTPVLYVAFDIEARGPVGTMQPSRGVFAGALVIAPEPGDRSLARLSFEVVEDAHSTPTSARAQNAALVEGNAMANGLPLFEALADGVERQVVQALAPQLSLRMQITPAAAAQPTAKKFIQRAR